MLVGLLACACGGRTDRLEGLEGPTGEPACDTNAYGVCYPSDVGTAAMQTDASGNVVARGDRIANFRFVGFPSPGAFAVDDVTEARTISLADFYDPAGQLGIKILHVMVNVRWCGPSNEEADFVSGANATGQNAGSAAFARELEPLGVRFLEILTDGLVIGHPATLDDLRAWVTQHEVDYAAAVAGGAQSSSGFLSTGELGPFFTNAAIPFNMVIDARSMEILYASTGFDSALDVRLKTWLAWQDAHAAL